MLNFSQTMRDGSCYRGGSLFFTGQHTNPMRAARRAAVKAAGGIRQFKKQTRKGRRD